MSPSLALALLLAQTWPPATWHLEVSTDGGYRGRGRGAIELRSDGSLFVTPHAGPRCDHRLEPRELERLNVVIAAARPKQWLGRYALATNPLGRDEYGTTVVLIAGRGDAERQFTVGWYDDSRKLVPMDAQRLGAAAISLLKRHPCPPPREGGAPRDAGATTRYGAR